MLARGAYVHTHSAANVTVGNESRHSKLLSRGQQMKIGIIGAGRMGGTLTALLSRAGHSVHVANSRGPDSLKSLIAEGGANTSASTIDEAVRSGAVVIIAIPWTQSPQLPEPRLFAGKIVVDATNSFGNRLADDDDRTTTEQLTGAMPAARVVKAFNTMNFQVMRAASRRRSGEKLALYAAGDDVEAKNVVIELIEDIGFVGIDTGSLRVGGMLQEPGGPLFNADLTASAARARLRRS